MTLQISYILFMADQDERSQAYKKKATDVFPMYLKALEKMMTQNGSTGFYVGSTMTIADITTWRLLGWISGSSLEGYPAWGKLEGIPTNILDPYPQIMANMKNTGEHPKIAAWMAKHYAGTFSPE